MLKRPKFIVWNLILLVANTKINVVNEPVPRPCVSIKILITIYGKKKKYFGLKDLGWRSAWIYLGGNLQNIYVSTN